MEFVELVIAIVSVLVFAFIIFELWRKSELDKQKEVKNEN